MDLGILECDHVPQEFTHIAGDYRDMVTAMLTRDEAPFKLKYFDVCEGQIPSVNDCDAFLCLGSRYSVYDNNEWIRNLKQFVRRVHRAERPFVGICFGHQLLAEALGGSTARASKGWGVGVHMMDLIRYEEWMLPKQGRTALKFMHQDQIERLPPNGVLLGQTKHCPIAMFRVGRSMLGLQAHPELTSAYCYALLSDRVQRIGEAKVREAKNSLNQPTDEILLVKWITRFLLAEAQTSVSNSCSTLNRYVPRGH
jgi:GMP synthase-like glutamine amidotransferase